MILICLLTNADTSIANLRPQGLIRDGCCRPSTIYRLTEMFPHSGRKDFEQFVRIDPISVLHTCPHSHIARNVPGFTSKRRRCRTRSMCEHFATRAWLQYIHLRLTTLTAPPPHARTRHLTQQERSRCAPFSCPRETFTSVVN